MTAPAVTGAGGVSVRYRCCRFVVVAYPATRSVVVVGVKGSREKHGHEQADPWQRIQRMEGERQRTKKNRKYQNKYPLSPQWKENTIRGENLIQIPPAPLMLH